MKPGDLTPTEKRGGLTVQNKESRPTAPPPKPPDAANSARPVDNSGSK